MNRIISVIIILFACSSCQVYHYNILRSSTQGNNDEPFTFENDSIAVSYSFDGGLIDLTINNKSSKPLFVNWRRSAIIDNGVSYPFWIDEFTSFGHDVEVIPPDSKIINRAMKLPEIMLGVNGPAALMFNQRNSPLRFRGYLVLDHNETFNNPIVFDDHFWLGEVYEYKKKIITKPKQNAYLTKEITEAGKFTGGMTVVGLLVGYVVVSSDIIPQLR